VKTECLKKELILYETNLWGANRPVKYVFETATDIFSITVYKKNIFGRWKKRAWGWNFHGAAKQLLNFLTDWLE